MLRLQPIDSSSIDLAGYDDEALRLYVRFRDSGDIYSYFDVPPEVFEAFLHAASKGRYHNASIKGQYRFRQLKRLPRGTAS